MKKEQSQSLATEYKWAAFAGAISITIILTVPFPTAFLALAAVFAVVGFMISMRDNSAAHSHAAQVAIHCHCLNCGTEHNYAACPSCGSKARKASFSDNQFEGEVAL